MQRFRVIGDPLRGDKARRPISTVGNSVELAKEQRQASEEQLRAFQIFRRRAAAPVQGLIIYPLKFIIIMKGSLMKPPAVADLFDHKLYPHSYQAPTKTIYGNWTSFETRDGASFSNKREKAWIFNHWRTFGVGPSRTSSMKKTMKSHNLTSNFWSSSKKWNPIPPTTPHPPNDPSHHFPALSSNERSSRLRGRIAESSWRWRVSAHTSVGSAWLAITSKPKRSSRASPDTQSRTARWPLSNTHHTQIWKNFQRQ